MKTTMKQIFAKTCGAALLLATCVSLSSCVIVDRHHRHYRDWEAPAPYHHEVRP
jgi:cytochrome c biogenesis protein ResB